MRSFFIAGVIVLFGASCSKNESCQVHDYKEDCLCGYVLAPVCGCDGKSYPNECEAACNGIYDYTNGTCE
ncbi:MAG: hypothetical protein MRY78_11615 [Saprospiraceae bacterium]|nr:hypothetical protein [Saprospiraceae bacterium]